MLHNRRMARPKEHNPEFVLESAMKAFWADGYEGTSIRDLAKACKLTTRSMYNAYPDKDSFFEAALELYQQIVLNPLIQILELGHGFSAIKAFFEVLEKGSTADGCLFFNTSASRHLVRPLAAKKVDRYIYRLRETLIKKLEEERVARKFSGNSELRADQIVASIMGFVQSLKAGISNKRAGAVLNQLVLDIQNE